VIILDTNVTSELMRAEPTSTVIAWLTAQSPNELFSTVVTVAEISYGLERLPSGRRRKSLEKAYQSLFTGMAEEILPFDVEAAFLYGPLMARKERAGSAMNPMDAQIACIAASHGATIATRNESDFANCGVKLINPWRHLK
jgi:predicted nucleic acid-binding protein